MPDPNQADHQDVRIPDALQAQLDAFRRQLWRIKITESIAAGVIGALFSFLLVYGLDRLMATPSWLRLAILLSGMGLFAGFAPYWLHRWVWKHRREAQLARLVATRFPGLGDRLLGVIELQHQKGSAETLSPRLRQAAMEAVAAETGRRPLMDAMPPSRTRLAMLATLILLGAVGVAFFATPQAGWNAVQRWLMPWSDTERYTFTRLMDVPDELVVAHGEAFDVVLQLSPISLQRPATATGRLGAQQAVEVPLSDGGRYVFTFAGQQVPGMLVFRIGDLRHRIRIVPMQRPVTEQIAVMLTPPDYLQIPPRRVELLTGVANAVEGSRVRIDLTANRRLQYAEFGPTRVLEDFSYVDDDDVTRVVELPVSGAMEVRGNAASSPEFVMGRQSIEFPMRWTDEFGLASASGFNLRIESQSDQPPACYIQGVERQVVILPEESIEFELLGEDDYGVKAMGIEWEGALSGTPDGQPAQGELILTQGGPEQRRLTHEMVFSPATYSIQPQKVELRAWAEDYHPTHGKVYSQSVTIYVLTREEHAQMMKNQFDQYISEFEDVARRELKLFEENQRLDRLDGEALQDPENRDRINNQEQAEAENTRAMEELTQKMEQLMMDAMRNGEIQKETMQKMAEALKSMQELAREDMPKVQEKLSDAQQPSNTPEKSDGDMRDAVEEQQQVLDKMNEAIEKANDANHQFEAGTFIARLKKAAGEQNGIVNSIIGVIEEIAGLVMLEVDPSYTRTLNENAGQQSTTASDVRWIQEDLANFFARTNDDAFMRVYQEMRESEIDLGLVEVRKLLLDNHSYMAAEGSKKWADRLAEWAADLEGAMDDANGGGGGGGGPDAEDEDFEFMLRVMKMIQQQQDLRGRTRSLEQLKRSTLEP